MKKNLKILSLLLLAMIFIYSCQKEEMSLENPELRLNSYLSEGNPLNCSQSELEVYCKIAPEDANNNQITVKYTSEADPTGIEITYDLEDGDYTDGSTKYLYKKFSDKIYAANHTDAENKYLKVAPDGDIINVVVGENIVSNTFIFDGEDIITCTYWSLSEATIFIYGYNFDGTENLKIQAWTTRDNQPIDIDLNFNNPAQYQVAPQFSNYDYNINFVDSWSSIPDTLLGVYPPEDKPDTLFFKYNNKTYFSVYNSNTHLPLEEF